MHPVSPSLASPRPVKGEEEMSCVYDTVSFTLGPNGQQSLPDIQPPNMSESMFLKSQTVHTHTGFMFWEAAFCSLLLFVWCIWNVTSSLLKHKHPLTSTLTLGREAWPVFHSNHCWFIVSSFHRPCFGLNLQQTKSSGALPCFSSSSPR